MDKFILKKQIILVFFALYSFSVALAQNTMGVTTATTMPRWKCPPSTPALGLLANLKKTHEVKGACRVEVTSITTIVKE
jgi:hypothetical protein